MLYERYLERWTPGNFEGGLSQCRGFANFFLVAQATQARSDIALEQRKAAQKAAATAAAATRASRPTGSYPQKARGRKRAPSELSTNRASSPSSLPASSKQAKIVEKPELQFQSFIILLQDRDNRPATPYDKVWQFEDLIKWILTKTPPCLASASFAGRISSSVMPITRR
jgi:hypothetical protein